jgi:hypothetical protein
MTGINAAEIIDVANFVRRLTDGPKIEVAKFGITVDTYVWAHIVKGLIIGADYAG